MTVNALIAAKEFCKVSNWSISNLKLQKLLYIAHMYLLGRSEGKNPLVDQTFEAWDYGPVLPDVYKKCKTFGSGNVGNVFHSIEDMEDGDEKNVILECYDGLGSVSPGKLVAITHWVNGAWANRYVPEAKGILIPNDEIFEEYQARSKSSSN